MQPIFDLKSMVLGRKSCFSENPQKTEFFDFRLRKKVWKIIFWPRFFFSKNIELWLQNGIFTSGIPPVAFSNDFFEILMYDITVSVLHLKKILLICGRFSDPPYQILRHMSSIFLGKAWIRIYRTLGFQKNRLRRLLEVCPM